MVKMNSCHPIDVNGGSANESPSELGNSKETMDILVELSSLMNTHLDLETLAISQRLIENGVSPQVLAKVISQLRKGEFRKNSNGDVY